MLRVAIAKRADGSGVLSCTRADGSALWQKQERHAAFFALHDLTHFAVETVLGKRRGFFGLIAEGWDIDDTEGRGNRGAVPPEAIEVEILVGMLDAERAGGTVWSIDEFNEMLALKAGDSPPRLTSEELNGIRKRRAELFRAWSAVQSGEKLELTFGE